MCTSIWLRTLLATALLPAASLAETPAAFELPTTNPKAVARQRLASTEIEVSYNRPSVRGRAIFGALVPYGQVWRTGSDAATRITFSTEVSVGGQPLAAGAYELFSIPGAEEWVVILQAAQSRWGSYAYDPANDVARVTVRPITLADRVESFTISLDEVKTRTATLNVSWDRVRVPVEIAVDLEKTVVPQLEAALRGEGRRPYFLAAMFYYDNDLDLERAAELIALAVEANPDHVGMVHRQALILAKKGDRPGAIAAAERSLALAAAQGRELREEYTRLNEALLARLRAPDAR